MYKKINVFIAACMGISFFGISMISMGSVLPQLSAKFGLNQLEASELLVFLPIGILAGSLLFGPIVDRWGYKYLSIISSLLVVAGLEGLAFLDSILPLKFAILTIGLGGGILNGLTNALVSDITDDSDRGAKLSLLGAFYGIGALGLPVLLGTLSDTYSYNTILQYIGFFILMCIVYFFTIRFPQAKQAQGFPLKAGAALLKQPFLLLLGFVLFFQSAVEGITNNWTTTYLGDISKIPADKALYGLTCMVAGITAARLLMAGLFRKIGERRLLIGSLALAIIGYGLLLFVPGTFMSYAAMSLVGLGLASTFPVIFGILGRTYTALSGTAFSIALVIALTGNTLLNYLMGFIAEQWSISLFPVIMIASVCAMLLLFSAAVQQKKKIN